MTPADHLRAQHERIRDERQPRRSACPAETPPLDAGQAPRHGAPWARQWITDQLRKGEAQ